MQGHKQLAGNRDKWAVITEGLWSIFFTVIIFSV